MLPDDRAARLISDAVACLSSAPTPRVLAVSDVLGIHGPAWTCAHRAVILPGSFNPLHAAHLALLRAAVDACPGLATDEPLAALSMSVHTIDKGRPSGMRLEDRAWTMHAAIEQPLAGVRGVALIASHGLYLDQAIGLHAAMPHLDRDGLWFAIGYDKLVQVLDPRYYDDRDAALDALFERAGLLVAPRAGATQGDVEALTAAPGNRPFRERVRSINLPINLAGLSSTTIRSGADAERGDLPAAVAAMVAARRCYG